MAAGGNDNRKTGTPKPPDGGWGWFVVAASFLIHVIADGIAYTFGIFLVDITTDFDESRGATSWIPSIMAGMTYGSGPVAGALVNKFGCRITSIIGSFVAAFGFAISYFAKDVVFLYISIGLIGGLGLGLIYLPAIVSVTSYFDKRRAFATGIAVCGSGFGTAGLAPLVGGLIRYYHWRFALVITGGIILSCAFFSCFFRPLKEEIEGEAAAHGDMPSQPHILEPDVQQPLIIAETEPEYPSSPQSAVEPLEQSFSVQYLKPTQNESLTMSSSQPALRAVVSIDNFHRFDPNRKRHSLRVASFGKFDQNQNSSEVTAVTGACTPPPGLIVERKDIFYSGSLLRLPDINSTTVENKGSHNLPNGSCNTLDHISMKPLEGDEAAPHKRCCGCLPCPAEIKAAFKSMTDFTILKDPIFLFFAFSNFLTSVGYNVPYTYLVDLAIGSDINHPVHSRADAEYLISIVGIANTLSRVVLGYLGDKKWMNRLFLYNGALALCGLAIAVTPHVIMDLNGLRICSAVFGATVGVYVSLTSVILVDLLGLHNLTNAFGLLLLFQGVATVIGPPIVGALCDHYKNHLYGFGLAGIMIGISGLMLFFVPLIQRRRERKQSSTETDSAATEQQALSSGKQSTLDVEITGTITGDDPKNQIRFSNGVCNGTAKISNNNFNEV